MRTATRGEGEREGGRKGGRETIGRTIPAVGELLEEE